MKQTSWAGLALVLGLALGAGSYGQEASRDAWPVAGGNLANTRHQGDEEILSSDNVNRLVPKWIFRTDASVSATPTVDEGAVYVPDWSGKLFSIDRESGEENWSRDIPEITGARLDFARTTPAIHGDWLVLGNQAGTFRGGGAKVLAFEKRTGETRWVTEIDEHPSSIVTQSPVIHGGRVYVGVSSLEETHAAVLPGYDCCSFRGSMVALDLATGKLLWRTSMVPDDPGFTGNAVWGSSPVVDRVRGSLYIATGNNYTVPERLATCIEAARLADAADEAAVRSCTDAVPGNYFDAVLALDLETGAVKWARSVLPFDAWTVSCVLELVNPENCPSPSGPDFDFGQGPALFEVEVEEGSGERRELLGAGQKSGIYWALDPDTGDVVWQTRVGPAGVLGGMMWGSAVDGERVYVANVNSNRERWRLVRPPTRWPRTTRAGFWSALDARTGAILWQTADPNRKKTEGAMTSANGVVFAGSMGRGPKQPTMFALSAETGEILWSFASGATVNSGPAVADGVVYWGSGYPPLKGNGGTPNDKLFAFELDGR